MTPSILLIEDGDDQRELLRSYLEDSGLSVTACAHPIEALPHLETAPPSAVLLDWYTPMMNGETFVRLVRARPGGAELPIVVLTGAPRLRNASVDAVLFKPIDLDALVSELYRQVHRSFQRVLMPAHAH
jgi:CheY-like chemotaxis protein